MYTVVLQKDFIKRQGNDYIIIKTNKHITKQVKTIKQAQRAVTDFIEKYDLRSSCFTGGAVYDGTGKQVGRISYNGRYWGGEK